MRRSYVIANEVSGKYWWIDSENNRLAIGYGSQNTHGTYQLKDFDTAQECAIEKEKLIVQKLNDGYIETTDFDFSNNYYFDDKEWGPDILTSHPHFSEHFISDFYYDCLDEEAPFGSNEGADTLSYVTEYIKEKGNFNLPTLPGTIIENYFGMEFFEPMVTNERELKDMIYGEDIAIIPNRDVLLQSDLVVIACAFAQAKITGRLDAELKSMSLLALERIRLVEQLLNDDKPSTTKELMRNDLASFTHIV